MLITKKFVVLNNPKTGSTFVRNVIKKTHERENYLFERLIKKLKANKPELTELILPNIKMPLRKPDQHGTYSQIPQKYINNEIISVVRNPFDRFLSIFEFRSWAEFPHLKQTIIREQFSTFPKLNLNQFVDLQIALEKIRLQKNENPLELGSQTIQFIQMFFKNPNLIFSKATEKYFKTSSYRKDLGAITFLRQENLNNELYNFLFRMGYQQNKIAFIQGANKSNVTKSDMEDRNKLWTPKAIKYIQHKERFLFKMLNDLGFQYDASFNPCKQ